VSPSLSREVRRGVGSRRKVPLEYRAGEAFAGAGSPNSG